MPDAPAWALALLGEARVGRLATADATGRPLVVPVCFVLDEDAIYWAVDDKPKRTRDLRRLRHIAENPHVCLVIDEWDEDWSRLRWVIVEGTAAVPSDRATLTRAVDLLRAKYPQYRAMNLARDSGTLVRIRIERVLAWRAAAPPDDPGR
jgi:PPOX class probable F420-dependent enzyme